MIQFKSSSATLSVNKTQLSFSLVHKTQQSYYLFKPFLFIYFIPPILFVLQSLSFSLILLLLHFYFSFLTKRYFYARQKSNLVTMVTVTHFRFCFIVFNF